MGLDIYFDGRERANTELVFELAYFRKVNSLVGWVDANVGPVENCEKVLLTQADIRKLLKDAIAVREALKLSEKGTIEIVSGVTKNEQGEWIDKKELVTAYVGLGAETAMSILPPTPGFFFGSTVIDEYYLEQIEHIIKEMRKILSTVDFSKEEVFFTCWW